MSFSSLLSKILRGFFSSLEREVSDRFLDSKEENDKELLKNAPKIYEYLSKESQNYFNDIKLMLLDNNITFIEDEKLVRGLDYYTHTAFEFQTNEEKRQNTILAGGRYDKLINMISSRDIPGIGWAAGIERMMDLLPSIIDNKLSKKLLLAVQDESYLLNSNILKQVYKSNIIHEIKINKNIKKLFTYADKNNFNFLVLIGEEEFKEKIITFKNLDNKVQKKINNIDLKLENEIR